MNNPRTLNDRNLYKILISVIKYMPITMLFLFVIGLILNYLGISAFVVTCIGGTSVLSITLLYLLSYVFRFCYLYRLPLHYIAISDIILILNKVKVILATLIVYRILAILLGLFLIAYITYWYLNRNRNNPNKKVDYIKDLCERYCNC